MIPCTGYPLPTTHGFEIKAALRSGHCKLSGYVFLLKRKTAPASGPRWSQRWFLFGTTYWAISLPRSASGSPRSAGFFRTSSGEKEAHEPMEEIVGVEKTLVQKWLGWIPQEFTWYQTKKQHKHTNPLASATESKPLDHCTSKAWSSAGDHCAALQEDVQP